MSAIGGFWTRASSGEADRRCRDILAALADLGGSGSAQFLTSEDCCLGLHLRTLLPEDRPEEPILTHTGSGASLVADIRLDNRAELASALGIAGGEPAMPEAELLLRALLRWGEEVLSRLHGDFAFAYFEPKRRRLLLARDALGQRPLFWSKRADGFAFASMPRGLHVLPGLARDPDLEAVSRYLAGLPQLGAASFHRNIQRVRPGHLLLVTPDGIRERRYWTPARRETNFASFDKAVEAFRDTLDRAVQPRLRRSAGPVASHLSGGWDSSAVTATAARLLAPEGAKLLAFTAAPASADLPSRTNEFANEGPLAAATAALYPNVDHRVVPSSGGSLIDYLDLAVRHFERPVFNLCNHGWLSRIRSAAAQSGATVLLTGEIGNWSISASPPTLLADYLRRSRFRDWRRESWAMLRQNRARLRGVAAASFGPWIPGAIWKRLAALSSSSPADTALHATRQRDLADEIEERLYGAPARPSDHWRRTLDAYSEMDFGEYRKGILAGWGIDKRDATADRRLLEFCLSLPLEMLLGNGRRRPLARAALADRLPSAVLDEQRKGIQAADWHVGLTSERQRIESLVEEIAADAAASSVVDFARLRHWLREWPRDGWHRPEIIARYRIALLVGITAGHFVLRSSR